VITESPHFTVETQGAPGVGQAKLASIVADFARDVDQAIAAGRVWGTARAATFIADARVASATARVTRCDDDADIAAGCGR
jgi:hypothetical protein